MALLGMAETEGPRPRRVCENPTTVLLMAKGGLLIAEIQDQRVRRLDIQTRTITTFAGTGEKAHSGDGGQATEAGVFGARAVCTDGLGNAYVCEREGNSIRRIDQYGIITTVAGSGEKGYSGDGGPASHATFNGPKAIRCDREGSLLVADTENHAIGRIDASTQIITTVAGGRLDPEGDGGDAVEAGLARPHGVAIDRSGGFYIADSENHRVRLVT